MKTKTHFHPVLSFASLLGGILFLLVSHVQTTHAISLCTGGTSLCHVQFPETVCSACPDLCGVCPDAFDGWCVDNYGDECTSAPNALCGLTNTGTISCRGTCTATTPPNSECPTTSCEYDGGNVFGFVYGQDYGKLYFEPDLPSNLDPSLCFDFGVTFNSDDSVDGEAFSIDYGKVDFNGAHIREGLGFSTLYGSLSFYDTYFTLQLPDISAEQCDDVFYWQESFDDVITGTLPKGICIDHETGYLAGWINHPTFGYINFNNAYTSWRPADPQVLVSVVADPISINIGETTEVMWKVDGPVETCVAETGVGEPDLCEGLDLTQYHAGKWCGVKNTSMGAETLTFDEAGLYHLILRCTITSQETTVYGMTPPVDVNDPNVTLESCNFTAPMEDGNVFGWIKQCGDDFTVYARDKGILNSESINYCVIQGLNELAGGTIPGEERKCLDDSPLFKIIHNLHLKTLSNSGLTEFPHKGEVDDDMLLSGGLIQQALQYFLDTAVCEMEKKGARGDDVIEAFGLNREPFNLSDHVSCKVAPTINTPIVTDVSLHDECATCNLIFESEVKSNGGSDITQKGFVYAMGRDPILDDIATNNIADTLNIGSLLIQGEKNKTDFIEGEHYFFKAYAKNAEKTGISQNSVEYVRPDPTDPLEVPTVSIPAKPITKFDNKVTLWGQVVSDGGSPVTERGIVISTSPNTVPTIDSYTQKKQPLNPTLNPFTIYFQNLLPNTLYYYRAYAINSVGVGYSWVVSFRTTQLETFGKCSRIGTCEVTTVPGATQDCFSSDECPIIDPPPFDPSLDGRTCIGGINDGDSCPPADSCMGNDPTSDCYDDGR